MKLYRNKLTFINSYFFLLNSSVILLFFSKLNVINISLGLLVAIVLGMSLSKKHFNQLLSGKHVCFVVLCALYFLLICLSYIFSEDKITAFNNLNRSVYFLIIPTAIIFGPHIDTNRFLEVTANYIISTLVYGATGLISVAYLYSQKMTNKFSYEAFGEALGVHTPYYGLFVAFGVGLTLVKIYESKGYLRVLGLVLLCCFHFLIFYMLSTRTAIVAVSLEVLSISVYYYRKGYKFKSSLILFSTVLGIFLVISNGFLKERIQEAIETDNNFGSGISSRGKHWKSVIEAYQVEGNFFFGNSTGDTQNILNKYYQKNNFFGYEYDYNAHNQYLESLMSIGIIGLMVLLCIFGLGFYIAIQNASVLLFCFMVITSICFITESMLMTQRGITFFLLIMSVLIKHELEK